MDCFPLNLVLAGAVAWAAVFLGNVPVRYFRATFLRRQILATGLLWMVVGAGSPWSIIHYHVLIGLLCLGAWWQLRDDEPFRGKMWFNIAGGLGISLGVVLILAVTPRAYPAALTTWQHAMLLASLYLGTGVIGLAYVVWVLTRREATQAEIPQRLVEGYAQLLFGMTFARALVLFAGFLYAPKTVATAVLLGVAFLVQPALAWIAGRRVRSPRPSTSGTGLLIFIVIGFVAEAAARWLAL